MLLLPELYDKYNSYEEHNFFDLPSEEKIPEKPVFEPKAKRIYYIAIRDTFIVFAIAAIINILVFNFSSFWWIFASVILTFIMLKWILLED